MKKYIKDLIKIFYILNLSACMANINIITDIEDETLSNCVVYITREASTNIPILDLTLVNIDTDLIISSLHNVRGLRFTSRTYLFDVYRIFNIVYIIESKNPKELTDGLSQVFRDVQWNHKAKYLIIVKKMKEHDLLHLGNLFFDHNIYNVILITTERRNHVIYQLNVTSNDNCRRSNNWVLVSSCSEYLTKKRLAFPKNDESIRNCQFKFITHSSWPYTNYDFTNIEGIEQRILKDYEKYKNVTIELYIVAKKNDLHGVVIPGYIDEMLKRVQDNEFEGAVGGLNTINNSIGYLSFVYPVTVDQSVYILAHAENLESWEILLSGSYESVAVIIVLIIMCVLITLLKIFTNQERDVTRDILLVLGYILNKTGVKNINPNLPQRIIFLNLSLLALLLPYTINASIYSSFTKPYRGYEPKDVDELPAENLMLHTEIAYKYPKIKNKCDSILDCLMDVKNDKTKSLYTILSKTVFLAFGSQITDDKCNKKVFKLGNAFTELRMIFLRRDSLILDDINKFIVSIASAGLISKYTEDISYLEHLKCHFHETDTMPINMSEMYIFYIMLIIGYMISLITFALELILAARQASKV